MAIGHRESAREGASLLFLLWQQLLAKSCDPLRSPVPQLLALAQDSADLVPKGVAIVHDQPVFNQYLPAQSSGLPFSYPSEGIRSCSGCDTQRCAEPSLPRRTSQVVSVVPRPVAFETISSQVGLRVFLARTLRSTQPGPPLVGSERCDLCLRPSWRTACHTRR